MTGSYPGTEACPWIASATPRVPRGSRRSVTPGPPGPATTMVQVERLIDPEMLVGVGGRRAGLASVFVQRFLDGEVAGGDPAGQPLVDGAVVARQLSGAVLDPLEFARRGVDLAGVDPVPL